MLCDEETRLSFQMKNGNLWNLSADAGHQDQVQGDTLNRGAAIVQNSRQKVWDAWENNITET